MIDSHIADRAVALLRELFDADPQAMEAIVNLRVSCNEALANHPTVQVGPASDGGWEVGLLGILNGLCGVYEGGELDGAGAIAAVVEKGTTQVIGFAKNE